MADDETVKVELELPKDQVHIEPVKQPASDVQGESDEAKLDKTRDILAEESPKKRIEKLRRELKLSRRAKDNEPSHSGLPNAVKELPIVKDKRPPNTHQRLLIGTGLIIAIIGLLLWPLTNLAAATLVALLGIAAVITGTFVRV